MAPPNVAVPVACSTLALEAERIGSRTVVLEWPFAIVAFTVAGLSAVSLVAQILGLLYAPKAHRPDEPGGIL